jgi:uncharacterized membrane protein
MSRRLLTALRNVAQDCETIAAAARKALREIEGAELLGTPVSDAKVQKYVLRLERRLTIAARRVGVQADNQEAA